MKIDLQSLLSPETFEREPPSTATKRPHRPDPPPSPHSRARPLEQLMRTFQGPLPNPLEHDEGQDPQPNAYVMARNVRLAAYQLQVTGRNLAALGTVLSVADLPIHTTLRNLVEKLHGPLGRRTPVDAARAHALFYGQWNRDRSEHSLLVIPVVVLTALRTSISLILSNPRGYKLLTVGPDLNEVRTLAEALTSRGLAAHIVPRRSP